MAIDPKKIARQVNEEADKLGEKQRESLRLQKEYNDALSFSVSLNGKILADIDSQVDYRTKLGKKAKEYLGELKSSINELETSEDIGKKLVGIEAEKNRISRSYVGANLELGKVYLEALDVAENSLRIEQQKLALTEKVADTAKDMVDNLKSSFDTMTSGLSEIPLIGGMLSKASKIGGDAITNKLGEAAKNFTINFKGGLDSGLGAMESLSAAAPELGGALMAALASPLVIVGLIAAALALGVKRFSEIDEAAKGFRESTGLLNSQTQRMVRNIQSVSTQYANLGITAADVGESAGEFVNAFDGLQQPAKSTIESMVVMNKNFGVGASEAAKVNKVMQNMGGLSERQAQFLSNSVVQMSKLAGVAPQKVMSDIAQNSGDALKYFRGQPALLAKSAVSLAAMGSSLQSAAKSSESLLNFESSVTDELEASALLGKELNFDKARAAAYAGDQLGQEKAIMEQMMAIGDISKMDMYQKEALAKATGKNVDELINMQRIQQQFPNLDKDRLAAAHALIDSGKDISKVSQADLDLQTKKMAAQQDMQSQMDKLSNSTSALGTGFMDMFEPLASFLMPVLTDIVDVLGSVLMPIMSALGSVFKIAFGALSAIWNVLMAIVKPIFAIGGAVFENISKPLARISDALAPLWAKFGELKDKIMEAITPILPIFSFIGDLLGTVIGGAIDVVVSAFSTLFDFLFAGFDAISGFITTYLVEPIMSFISMIQGAWDTVKGFFGFGDTANEATAQGQQSVNDGVMQGGQVISTDPADFLIASKNPSALAGQVAGGGDGGATTALVNSLIAEIQGMRADLSSGKVAVNIDGQRMNAKIAENAVRNPIT